MRVIDSDLCSPDFFAGKSVVLDVSGLSLTKRKFSRLIAALKKRKISIFAVEGANPSWLDDSVPSLMTRACANSRQQPGEQVAPPPTPPTSMLIEGPVRSGQSILCPTGDVTIIGSVASGAEIVAAGSIHVYGTLRGRALAGVNGNRRARIFCRRLDAELLAIDGNYSVAEELEPQFRQKSVHAWLDGEAVKVTTLD
jgi:septum site-determining protein MinC